MAKRTSASTRSSRDHGRSALSACLYCLRRPLRPRQRASLLGVFPHLAAGAGILLRTMRDSGRSSRTAGVSLRRLPADAASVRPRACRGAIPWIAATSGLSLQVQPRAVADKRFSRADTRLSAVEVRCERYRRGDANPALSHPRPQSRLQPSGAPGARGGATPRTTIRTPSAGASARYRHADTPHRDGTPAQRARCFCRTRARVGDGTNCFVNRRCNDHRRDLQRGGPGAQSGRRLAGVGCRRGTGVTDVNE